MSLVLASQPLDATSCAHWADAPKTSTRCGPTDATVDHYEASARIGASDTPASVFARLRDRLMRYDVFPPNIVRATVDHYEASARIGASDTPASVFARLRDRLMRYDVFPPNIVRATIYPAGRITAGATIVQRIGVGPLALEAAVRVIDVWDRVVGELDGEPGGVRVAGFRYVTLRGHPECGVASFEVRLGPKGEITIRLDARSRPGTWLTRLGRPFARRFQQAITRAALRRLADIDQP